jgi:ribosomal protein S27AE
VREGVDDREVSVLRGFYCVNCMFWEKHPKKDIFCIIGEQEYEIGTEFLECPRCHETTQLSTAEGRPYCGRCNSTFS